MLIFNLKKEWFEKIARGEKTVEYREVKPYWTKRINNELSVRVNGKILAPFDIRFMAECVDCSECPQLCILRLGYTKRQMTAYITKVEVVDGKDTDLHMDKPVYAIHLANVVSNE